MSMDIVRMGKTTYGVYSNSMRYVITSLYYQDEWHYTCTCPSHIFRHIECKHIVELKSRLGDNVWHNVSVEEFLRGAMPHISVTVEPTVAPVEHNPTTIDEMRKCLLGMYDTDKSEDTAWEMVQKQLHHFTPDDKATLIQWMRSLVRSWEDWLCEVR